MQNSINLKKESVVRKQNYTEQQKESAVNRYSNGEAVISIAKDFNTSRSTIYYWIKKARGHAIHVADNSVSESFNATLKEEELYRYHYHSEQEFRRSIQNYLDYYNNDRPHTTLKYLCPCQYEKINAS